MCLSRKKIRGYKRKIRQLNNWKESIINYPFNQVNRPVIKFNLSFAKYYFVNDINPPMTYTIEIIKVFFEIEKQLRENKRLDKKKWIPIIWLYFPNTLYSSIYLTTDEKIKEMEKEIHAVESSAPPIFDRFFPNKKWKCGKDVYFLSDNSENNRLTEYTQGNIWIPH